VVGNDVEHEAEAVLAGCPDELVVGGLSAELLRQPRVVDDVVPVGRAGRGLQDGGEVEVGDTELGEVRDDPRRGGEVELRPELEPVGRQDALVLPGSHAITVSGSCTSQWCGKKHARLGSVGLAFGLTPGVTSQIPRRIW
jgi:hypothetical protein